MNIGNRIHKLLIEKQITRKEMASKLNISYSAISKYITNQRTPDAETITKLADALDVSVDYLLGRVDNYRSRYLKSEKLKCVNQLSEDDQKIIQNLIYRLVDDSQ